MPHLRSCIPTIPLLVSLLLAASADAQVQQTGSLVGKVVDASGGVLPGVTVELTSPALIRPESTVTDAKGTYRFILLPIGVYKLTFTLRDFNPTLREQIPVSADKTLTLNVIMQVAGVAVMVTVSGVAPVVDVTSATESVHLDRKIIDDLPTSRNIWSLLQNQAPQVVTNREEVGGSESGLQATFSTHGSSRRQNTFNFDGINVTGVNGGGTTDLYFDYDTFDEVQISTGAHRAQVGTPGVYLNIIVRSGTDSWRGVVQDFFSNKNLQSENLTDELRNKGIKRGLGIDRINNFSVQFGGPIIKDRLRIYANYRDDRINRFVIGFPLTEDTIIKAPLVKATYQINDKNKVNGLYTYNKYDKPRREAGPLLSPDSTWIEDDHTHVGGASWQSTLTNNTLLNVRVGYTGQLFPLLVQPSARKPFTRELTTGQVTGAANRGQQNRHARLQLSGFLSYYKKEWLGGSHDFKFGYDISRGPNETFFFAFQDVNLFTLNGRPFSVLEYNTPARTRELDWFYPFYGQDTFTVGRTTISAGLRFEAYRGEVRESSVPAGRFSPARSFAARKGMSFNNLVPRVAVVYDVFGNSALALKGSYGRYLYTLSQRSYNAINGGGLGGKTYSWNDPNGDGTFQEGEESQLLSSFGGSITSIDPEVRQPHSDEFTFGIDSEIGRKIRLSALFVYRRDSDLLAITNPGVPFSAYTKVRALDPGEDGLTGTGDDGIIEVFNQDPSTLGKDRLLITNPGFGSTFRGFELTAQKKLSNRWQLLASFAASHQDVSASGVTGVPAGGFAPEEQEDAGLSTTGSPFLNPNNLINNTKGPGYFDRTYVLKTSGSYVLPGDVQVAAVFKAQSGTPYARVVTRGSDVDGAPLNQGSVTVFAEPRGSRRFPTVKILDLRIAKSFQVQRYKLEAILDIFNVVNVNTILSINGNTGSQFGAPLGILGPRVVRLGARLSF